MSEMAAAAAVPGRASKGFPQVWPGALDTLWLQVAGSICNIACTHCFISCSPTNHNHEMLSRQAVRARLKEAAELGVREYYFTGGEPFLNPDLPGILEDTLLQGPATVLTNGLLLDPVRCRELARLFDASEYSLDLRVSIEGYSAAANDTIRGRGTFERILTGIRNLSEAALNPVVTVTEACADAETEEGRTRFLDWMRSIGLSRPRLKVLSLFRIGGEARRLRAYESWETLAGRELTAEESGKLQCSSCRMITSRGVYVCPILIDEPSARMGDTLRESLRPHDLRYPSCYTCHEYGVTCRT